MSEKNENNEKSEKSEKSEKRLPVLDGLRGIAILQVVIFHLWQLSWFDIGYALRLPVDTYFIPATGYMGVEFFFFLSGFCLLYPLATNWMQEEKLPTWREYFLRRAWKILPSYWLAIAICLWFAPEYRTPLHVLTHLFFIHNWFYETHGSINGVLWSLGVEVQFYCLFPFIAPLFLRRPGPTFIAMILVGLAWRGVVLYYYPKGWSELSHLNNQLPAAFDLFALGMLGAYIVAYWQKREKAMTKPKYLPWVGLFFALLATVLLLGLLRYLKYSSGEVAGIQRWQNQWRFAYGLGCLSLTVGSCLAPRFWQQIIANRLLVFYGFISYNWYLWHQWVAAWLYKTHWVASQTPEPHDDTAWQPVFFVLVFFGGMTIAKWLTQYFEQPLIAWGKQKNLQRKGLEVHRS